MFLKERHRTKEEWKRYKVYKLKGLLNPSQELQRSRQLQLWGRLNLKFKYTLIIYLSLCLKTFNAYFYIVEYVRGFRSLNILS